MILFNKWWDKYERFVIKRHKVPIDDSDSSIETWKNRLYVNFLIYCFPISSIAAIPCIYISFKSGYLIIGVIDALCFSLIAFLAFTDKLSFKASKLIMLGVLYILSVLLIGYLGYMGPGVFYLFGITILSALILPIKFAYRTILANGTILGGFALFIWTKPFGISLLQGYSTEQWLAFSSNLIFFSLVLVLLIHRIFDGLQGTIFKIDLLQEKYRNIFQKSPLPMWLFDTETLKFLDVNESAISNYGYSREEFAQMTIRDIRPIEKVREIETIVAENRDAEKFFHNNIVHLKKNGKKIHVKIESSLLDFNGHHAKLVMVTDITAQLKSEQEAIKSTIKLKESEANLLAIFESSINGFVLLDINNVIKIFNSNARESVAQNYGGAEFKAGLSIFDYVEQTRMPYFNNLLNRVHNGEVVEYDRKFRRKDKTIDWIHYALTPVRNGDKVTGVCITGTDISARKKYVQTIEMQNKIFREISWMQSHLVRAPLARIMGLTALIALNTKEPDKLEMLEYLKISSDELDDIIRKITEKTFFVTGNQQISENDFLNAFQGNGAAI